MPQSDDVQLVARALHRLHVALSLALGDEAASDPATRCEQCAVQARVAVGALDRVTA